MISNGCIRHDPDLVASSIIELICDDLKYQDKQNDPQFLMLNNKLKEDKRISKIKKQMAKENKKGKKKAQDTIKRNSKFSNKYKDRIASIKESDEMIRIKEEKQNKSKNKKNQKAKTNIKKEEEKNVLEFRKEYEESMKKTDIQSKPKSARGRSRKK